MSATELLEHLPFATRVEQVGMSAYLQANETLHTLQINITKRCNLTCKHCHVAASPNRTEEMSRAVLRSCLAVFESGSFTALDITGGAPELHPHYEWLIEQAAKIAAQKSAALAQADNGIEAGDVQRARIITRTNLVILSKKNYSHLPTFWAQHNIEVACSLPHYEQRQTDRQRGDGVFEAAIAGLKALNAAGYGQPDSGLTVNIVVNPGGAFLPPAQASAEREYRAQLQGKYDVLFNNLLVITNNPVGRFKDFLAQKDVLDGYMARLYEAFNATTVAGMMCRDQISVDVDGRLFDCDFNQVIDRPILRGFKIGASGTDSAAGCNAPLYVSEVEREGLSLVDARQIRIGGHCYACTAGAGSSCGGAIT